MTSVRVSGVRWHEGESGGPVVGIIGLTHGNEPVGGRLLDELESLFETQLKAGRILCVKANEKAHEQGRRYTLGGTDLNRLWDSDTLTRLRAQIPATLCYEERRVLELAPLLLQCDVLVDIHSTTRPSPPFLLMRDDRRHRELVGRLGVSKVVTGLHEEGILGGGMAPDVGLRLGETSDRIGFTFEAGQHDDPVSWQQARGLLLKLLSVLEMLSDPVPTPVLEPEIFEVIDGFRQAPIGAERFRFVGFEGGEKGAGRRGPIRELASFETVQSGEEILRRSDGEVVRAPTRFSMLLPTPHAAPNTDLFYMALRRQSPLQQPVQPETDEQAQFLASGIEQTLDLLFDDEFSRGATWASFDNRQVLNIAADCVGRTMRLPPDHPHRKISIIGRGDWGGNLSEQRAGRRFRYALSLAESKGVSISRYQLMRGAPLDWLESLGNATGLDGLFLSVSHANHVSILVAGDLELALSTGDIRCVRVGLVVETAIPESDGNDVLIRVLRLGLFSARREFLRTAQRFMSQVKREHQWILDSLPVDEQLALSSDEQIGASRVATLHQLQVNAWREELSQILEDSDFDDLKALTKWIVDVMSRTSLLDAQSLRRWVARVVDSGVVVRKALLETGLDAWQEPLVSPASGQGVFGWPPVDASDVSGDNFERWLGWKRLLNSRQLIPDTRGQDTDLAFHVSSIQRKLAGWYRQARKKGAECPGQVRVVISGDGFAPDRERRALASALLNAHDALILDSNVSYLRIQHARGMNQRWGKALCQRIGKRDKGADCLVQLDAERRATVNAVLVLEKDDSVELSEPWTLEGWEVRCCAVVLEDYSDDNDEYAVGMFTESKLSEGLFGNPDLMHFGREYCESLLKKGGVRIGESASYEMGHELAKEIQSLLEGWAPHVASHARSFPDQKPEFLARRLGFRDVEFVKWAMKDEGTLEDYWADLKAWPPKSASP